MIMVPEDWKAFIANTLQQVRSGEIEQTRIDDAVRRILRVKMRAGTFTNGRPSSRPLAGDASLVGAADHRSLAREAVRRSLVLLKNTGGLLPLKRDLNVLVAGDGADDISKQSGGWSVTWQGTEVTNEDFPGATSIFAGVREAVTAGGGSATLSPDGSFDESPDVAIVVFGEDPYAEYEGDLESLNFSAQHGESLELLQRLKGQGVPIVSVFLSGRPLWVNPELNTSTAFVAAWWPGSEGGGVADVLFRDSDGEVSFDFTGVLSFSWPSDPSGPNPNRGDPDYGPLFPYGFGLTYGDVDTLPDDLPELPAARPAD
jgi:beta-glucosidase